MARQFYPRPHDFCLFGCDRWHIERVFNRACQQIIRHLFGYLQGYVFLGFGCRGAQVRGHNNVRQVEQSVFLGRFFSEYVKRSTSDMARLKGFGKRLFIHQAAASAVDNTHAGLHHRDTFGSDHVSRLFCLGHMQSNEVCPLYQIFKLDLFDTHLVRFFLAKKRVKRQNLHLEAPGSVADNAADVASANNAQSFIGQFGAHELGLFPFTCMGGL